MHAALPGLALVTAVTRMLPMPVPVELQPPLRRHAAPHMSTSLRGQADGAIEASGSTLGRERPRLLARKPTRNRRGHALWFEGARLIVGDGEAVRSRTPAFLVEGDTFTWVGNVGERTRLQERPGWTSPERR